MNGPLSKLDRLEGANRTLTMVLLLSMVINLVFGMLLVRTSTRTVTALVPIGSEAMSIGNGKADERYLRRMARYVINQIGIYSAGSARSQYQEVLGLFAPEKVTEVAKYFDRLVSDIERYPSISSDVQWAGQNPLKYTRSMIQVRAIKFRYVNGSVSERKAVTYCLDYRIEDATFWLLNIQEREEDGVDLCMVAPKLAAGAAAQPGG